MAGAYDDRDGKIWMDGTLVDWRDANVHLLTHAMHYASSVFEGERAYNGKIFESRKHSARLHYSASCIDFEIPWTVDASAPPRTPSAWPSQPGNGAAITATPR